MSLEMIFLLVVSYTILAIITIAFIVFAVSVKNANTLIINRIEEMSKKIDTVESFQIKEIRALLTDFRGMIGK